MASQKVCKNCKAIVDGSKCEKCGSSELADSFKGKIKIINPEQSDIAQHLKIKQSGTYALKIG